MSGSLQPSLWKHKIGNSLISTVVPLNGHEVLFTATSGEVVTYGGLTVDFTGRLVYIDGKRVDMTPKEYDLFFYLVKNKGIALTREKLINEVWGYDFYGDDRTLDTHIKLLRKSLGEYSGTITTLRGVGYRFEGC